jgi:hypothetical protein
MAQGYLAQVQALIAERMKENPEEMKRKLKEIEEAKKKTKKAPKAPPKPLFDPQLTKKLIEEFDKEDELDIQKIKDLIKRGADIKAKNKYEATVLHQASWLGDIELAKECLQAGINVIAKEKFGMSPLHVAVDWDNVEVAKFLISAGAYVDAKTNYYVKSQEMEALLKQHGAK